MNEGMNDLSMSMFACRADFEKAMAEAEYQSWLEALKLIPAPVLPRFVRLFSRIDGKMATWEGNTEEHPEFMAAVDLDLKRKRVPHSPVLALVVSDTFAEGQTA